MNSALFERIRCGLIKDFDKATAAAAADPERRRVLGAFLTLAEWKLGTAKAVHLRAFAEPVDSLLPITDAQMVEQAVKRLHLFCVMPCPSRDIYRALVAASDGPHQELGSHFGSWLEAVDDLASKTKAAVAAFLPGLHAHGAGEELGGLVDRVRAATITGDRLDRLRAAGAGYDLMRLATKLENPAFPIGPTPTSENVATTLHAVAVRHAAGPPHLDPNDLPAVRERLLAVIEPLARASVAATDRPDDGGSPQASPETDPLPGGNVNGRSRKPTASINARMIDAAQQDPERQNWSARQWALHLHCGKSAVAAQPYWRTLQQQREANRITRAMKGNPVARKRKGR